MSLGLFTNGNARITRLVILEMAVGAITLALIQILGSLPAQDWMTPHVLKITSFILGTVLSVLKGMEMFFSKTVSLYQHKGEAAKTGVTETTVTTETEKQ